MIYEFSALKAVVVGPMYVLIGLAVSFGSRASAGVAITKADPTAVRAAIEAGGNVTLAFDGVLQPTRTYVITTNTTIDATGHSVTFDAAHLVRHFTVTNGASLSLLNLTLINGLFTGVDGQTNEPGDPGYGGSVYNSKGSLQLIGCRFSNNAVTGGNGGPPSDQGYPPPGGDGCGGAVACVDGQLRLVNCFFADNTSLGGSAAGLPGGGGHGFGGGLFLSNSVAQLMGVMFTNNSAQGRSMPGYKATGGGSSFGGAVSDDSGTTLIGNCLFVANHSLGHNRPASGSPFTIGGNGGAVAHRGGTMTIYGTLLSDNLATGADALEIGTSNIYANAAGGAIFNSGDLGVLKLRNYF
jgi:hypothetical protein